jgi:hypothetical protein
LNSLASRFGWLTLLGALSLPAVTITGYQLGFNGSPVNPGPDNINASFAGSGSIAGAAFYNVTGTLDLFAGGQPVTPGSDFTGPFSLRFTNALITCGAQAGQRCGATSLDFSALVFLNTDVSGWAGIFGVEGTGVGFNVFNAVVSNLFNDQLTIANATTNGSFSRSLAVPAGFSIANVPTVLIMGMSMDFFNGMAGGTSISLPDSLFQQVGLDSPVPEPGTVVIVAAGLAGAFWFRRRQG